jgi:hypothetical protein
MEGGGGGEQGGAAAAAVALRARSGGGGWLRTGAMQGRARFNPSGHGAPGNGAIHASCGPERPRWKIPRRRGLGRRAAEPRRRGGGRREKGLDREFFSNPVYFVLNFAKKVIFVVFYSIHILVKVHVQRTYNNKNLFAHPEINKLIETHTPFTNTLCFGFRQSQTF